MQYNEPSYTQIDWWIWCCSKFYPGLADVKSENTVVDLVQETDNRFDPRFIKNEASWTFRKESCTFSDWASKN